MLSAREASKIAEFAAFCVLKIDAYNPPEAAYEETNEIQHIQDAHRRIFGSDASGATIVRIVGRNLLKEVGPNCSCTPHAEFTPTGPNTCCTR